MTTRGWTDVGLDRQRRRPNTEMQPRVWRRPLLVRRLEQRCYTGRAKTYRLRKVAGMDSGLQVQVDAEKKGSGTREWVPKKGNVWYRLVLGIVPESHKDVVAIVRKTTDLICANTRTRMGNRCASVCCGLLPS